MVERITMEGLGDYAPAPAALRTYLGRYAEWWLPDPARVGGPTTWRQDGGSAVIPIHNPAPGGWPGLPEGILLPVQWRRGAAHSTHLPRELTLLASTALSEVQRAWSMSGADDWGLHPLPDFEHVDLSALAFTTCHSAFVPLAVALIVARTGGKVRLNALSTGRWDDTAGAIASVNGVPQKIGGARALLDGPFRFFVPLADLETARRTVCPGATIEALPAHQPGQPGPGLIHQLRPLLEALEVPPDRGAPLEVRFAYANRADVVENDGRRQRYFQDIILPDLADTLRTEAPTATRVLLAANPRSKLNELTFRIFDGAELWLIATDDATADAARKQLGGLGRGFSVEVVDDGAMRARMPDLAKWLQAADGGGAVQITDGLSSQKVHLVLAAQAAGAPLVDFQSRYTARAQVDFGTLQITVLSAKAL